MLIACMSLSLIIRKSVILFKEGLYFTIAQQYYHVMVKENEEYHVTIQQVEREVCKTHMGETLPPEIARQFSRYIHENKILGMIGKLVVINDKF